MAGPGWRTPPAVILMISDPAGPTTLPAPETNITDAPVGPVTRSPFFSVRCSMPAAGACAAVPAISSDARSKTASPSSWA